MGPPVGLLGNRGEQRRIDPHEVRELCVCVCVCGG